MLYFAVCTVGRYISNNNKMSFDIDISMCVRALLLT